MTAGPLTAGGAAEGLSRLLAQMPRPAGARHVAALEDERAHRQPPYGGGQPETAGYNDRLAEPLAVIARANLARLDELLDRRRRQARLLPGLLAATPGISEAATPAGGNGYSAPTWLDLTTPRAFCEHLARLGVPDDVGTLGLVPAGRRAAFARYAGPPCQQAATVIDRTLAVILDRSRHRGTHRRLRINDLARGLRIGRTPLISLAGHPRQQGAPRA